MWRKPSITFEWTARLTLNQSQGKYFLRLIMRKQSLRTEANRYLKTNKSGCFELKKRRYQVIHQLIDALFIIGDVPRQWQELSPTHMHNIVRHWHKKKIKPSTMMKHMTIIRSFFHAIGNSAALLDNKTLGIVHNKNLRKKINIRPNIWQEISNPTTLALMKMQTHFGLTLSEAMRLVPEIHINDHALSLTREMTFNSLDRSIPLRTEVQMQILNKLKQLTPSHKSLRETSSADSIRLHWNQSLKTLKIPSNKSYRYLYAQQMQEQLQPLLGHYLLNLLIMDEMGIKSRTTLWHYLNE